MKALRIQVERVVRPIQASDLRKDRMREELLAHLTRLFEEALQRSGDTESAAAEAIDRFGDAPALSRELQESVPRLERWAFFRFPATEPPRRREGETPLGYLRRMNCWGAAIGIVAYVALALAMTVFASRRPHRAEQVSTSHVFAFLMCVGVIQVATLFISGLLNEGIRQELERRDATTRAAARRSALWHVAGYAAAGSVLLGGAAAGMMLFVEAFIPVPIVTRAAFWWVTLGAAGFGIPSTLLLGWSWKASVRRFEWESLDLDEHPAT